MLPGPVFLVELVTTSRRARTYIVRALYGAGLLFVIWQNYQASFWWQSGANREISVREMASLGQGLFWSFVVVQTIAVMLLTLVLTAGVIADEKQRKTLHYLLASRLSSAEIVLGKLLSRLLQLVVFLAVGLPVFSLLTLFGGIEPELIGLTYLLTGTLVLFLAGMGILVSTYARTVREALIVVFILILAWLILPLLLNEPLRAMSPTLHALVQPMNAWLSMSSPFTMFTELVGTRSGMTRALMVAGAGGLQSGLGLSFMALSVWRLRPVFRAQMGGTAVSSQGWRERLSRPWRLLPRSEVRDDPMLWKELNIERSGGIVRWIVRLASVVIFSLIGFWTCYYARDAAWEFWSNSSGWRYYGAVSTFNSFLRFLTGLLHVLWLLGVSANASSSITTEKEEDTWVSLVATPLTATEILRAKMIGAVWRMRALGFVLVGLWLTGLATGAIHPLGVLALVVSGAVFTAFTAALGVTLSMRCRDTTRASVASVMTLLFLNGGYLLCCLPLRPSSSLIALGCTPFLMAMSALGYEEVGFILALPFRDPPPGREWLTTLLVTWVLGVLMYGFGAVIVTATGLRSFDDVIDRPSRGLDSPPMTPKRPPSPGKVVKPGDDALLE